MSTGRDPDQGRAPRRQAPVTRPRRLASGDTVAVLSPSWGGPAAFPHVFDHGLAMLRDWA